MSEQELWRRLERDVKTPDLSSIWEGLVEEGAVEAVLDKTQIYEHFLEEAERLAGYQRRSAPKLEGYTGPRPGRSSGAVVEARLEPWEQAYADTCARYLELRAEKWPGVIRFRQEVLAGCVSTWTRHTR